MAGAVAASLDLATAAGAFTGLLAFLRSTLAGTCAATFAPGLDGATLALGLAFLVDVTFPGLAAAALTGLAGLTEVGLAGFEALAGAVLAWGLAFSATALAGLADLAGLTVDLAGVTWVLVLATGAALALGAGFLAFWWFARLFKV